MPGVPRIMAEKKLQKFLSNLLRAGCVKGFKYFATHLRGREELICSIINEPSLPILLSTATSPSTSFARDNSLLPKEPDTFLIGHKRQRRLSGYGYIDVGLPPASPSCSEDEMSFEQDDCTMFLIACYARYASPYVWVRSSHERLVGLSKNASEKDYPLQLNSTTKWADSNVEVWNILAELVQVCTSPCPPNPFSVDLDYFDSLPAAERLLATSAMLNLLKSIVLSGQYSYSRHIQSDILCVSQCHFHALMELEAPQS